MASVAAETLLLGFVDRYIDGPFAGEDGLNTRSPLSTDTLIKVQLTSDTVQTHSVIRQCRTVVHTVNKYARITE